MTLDNALLVVLAILKITAEWVIGGAVVLGIITLLVVISEPRS